MILASNIGATGRPPPPIKMKFMPFKRIEQVQRYIDTPYRAMNGVFIAQIERSKKLIEYVIEKIHNF